MKKGFKFVEITPIFRKAANEIVDRYMIGDLVDEYKKQRAPGVLGEDSTKRYRNAKGGKLGAGARSMREQSSMERNMSHFKSLSQDQQSMAYAKWATHGRMHFNTTEFKAARDQYNETRIVNTLFSQYKDAGQRASVIDWSSFGSESAYRTSLSSVRRFFSSVRDGKL
jgi:hypothetical protein